MFGTNEKQHDRHNCSIPLRALTSCIYISVIFFVRSATLLPNPTAACFLQAEQMADLREKWKKTKEESKKQHGTYGHLELPDIIITHEMTYEAPPGKANADRPMPLPRTLVRLLDCVPFPLA